MFDSYDGQYKCIPCDRWFVNRNSGLQHLTMSVYHDYCVKCDKEFSSHVSLQQHLNTSNAHVENSLNLKCPNCNARFNRYSQLANHVETKHSSRRAVENYIRSQDQYNVVTVPMIGWNQSDDDFSQYSSSTLAEFCYKGYQHYECPYNDCYKVLQSASNLWNHVNSKAHSKYAYHCPGCRKTFVSVGGLFTHFEYGCRNREEAAQGFAQMMNSMRTLGFH
ncbi:hypothetical protein BC833DRAFT_619608 [Globomyces pollinis-pini]|nr:hypothetical protein BC833DRAFT_619608 [Globomyces pollinis-pini]